MATQRYYMLRKEKQVFLRNLKSFCSLFIFAIALKIDAKRFDGCLLDVLCKKGGGMASCLKSFWRAGVLAFFVIAIQTPLYSLGVGGFINLTPSTNFCEGFFITGLTFTLAGENLPFIFMAETSADVIDHNFTINAAFDFPLHTFCKNISSNNPLLKTLPAFEGEGEEKKVDSSKATGGDGEKVGDDNLESESLTRNGEGKKREENLSSLAFDNIELKSLFKWNIALGALVGTTLERDNAKLNMAPRLSATFSWEKLDGFLEPFLIVALQPTYTLDFLNHDNTFRLLIPVGVGVRVWD